jgi:hypothetical protein
MFDPNQARLLQAMGYTLLQRRSPAEAGDGAGAAPASPATTTAANAGDAGAAPALWNAVLAAAGLDATRAEACGLRRVANGIAFGHHDDELWIDLQALRGDARAKRALWRTLRALRRSERERTR